MNRIKQTTTILTLASIAFLAGHASAREQIRIVGSSTVYPFSTVVAEEFGRATSFKTPIVESTGTGGGLKLFCAGAGAGTPDIANASRRIKQSEIELCEKNGISKITEVKVGYDGIAIARSKESSSVDLTLRQIFLALAREVPTPSGQFVANPNITWRDVDASLPDVKIEVLGPPPTSGTRDAFNELALEGGCKTFPEIKALKKIDKTAYKRICHSIREDGAYVEAGENDNLIVQKLVANPSALGIFGYGFLDQNRDRIRGSLVNGVDPSFDNIASGVYPVSRPLFIYVKGEHIGTIPGISEYVSEFTSEKAVGDYGYLADRGLIPAPADERKRIRADVDTGKVVKLAADH
jgi:phosphate transport system substrate-binding protein